MTIRPWATPPDTELQRFYSVPEVADRLGVSENFIRARIHDGTIPATDLGTRQPKLRIAHNQINAYLATRTTQGEQKS